MQTLWQQKAKLMELYTKAIAFYDLKQGFKKYMTTKFIRISSIYEPNQTTKIQFWLGKFLIL